MESDSSDDEQYYTTDDSESDDQVHQMSFHNELTSSSESSDEVSDQKSVQGIFKFGTLSSSKVSGQENVEFQVGKVKEEMASEGDEDVNLQTSELPSDQSGETGLHSSITYTSTKDWFPLRDSPDSTEDLKKQEVDSIDIGDDSDMKADEKLDTAETMEAKETLMDNMNSSHMSPSLMRGLEGIDNANNTDKTYQIDDSQSISARFVILDPESTSTLLFVEDDQMGEKEKNFQEPTQIPSSEGLEQSFEIFDESFGESGPIYENIENMKVTPTNSKETNMTSLSIPGNSAKEAFMHLSQPKSVEFHEESVKKLPPPVAPKQLIVTQKQGLNGSQIQSIMEDEASNKTDEEQCLKEVEQKLMLRQSLEIKESTHKSSQLEMDMINIVKQEKSESAVEGNNLPMESFSIIVCEENKTNSVGDADETADTEQRPQKDIKIDDIEQLSQYEKQTGVSIQQTLIETNVNEIEQTPQEHANVDDADQKSLKDTQVNKTQGRLLKNTKIETAEESPPDSKDDAEQKSQTDIQVGYSEHEEPIKKMSDLVMMFESTVQDQNKPRTELPPMPKRHGNIMLKPHKQSSAESKSLNQSNAEESQMKQSNVPKTKQDDYNESRSPKEMGIILPPLPQKNQVITESVKPENPKNGSHEDSAPPTPPQKGSAVMESLKHVRLEREMLKSPELTCPPTPPPKSLALMKTYNLDVTSESSVAQSTPLLPPKRSNQSTSKSTQNMHSSNSGLIHDQQERNLQIQPDRPYSQTLNLPEDMSGAQSSTRFFTPQGLQGDVQVPATSDGQQNLTYGMNGQPILSTGASWQQIRHPVHPGQPPWVPQPWGHPHMPMGSHGPHEQYWHPWLFHPHYGHQFLPGMQQNFPRMNVGGIFNRPPYVSSQEPQSGQVYKTTEDQNQHLQQKQKQQWQQQHQQKQQLQQHQPRVHVPEGETSDHVKHPEPNKKQDKQQNEENKEIEKAKDEQVKTTPKPIKTSKTSGIPKVSTDGKTNVNATSKEDKERKDVTSPQRSGQNDVKSSPQPAMRNKEQKQEKGAKSEEIASKSGYIMVIGLSETTSEDNLLNFMEGKSGTNVKDIVYGPRRENAVVIFDGKPDQENLQSKISKKTLDGKVIKVFSMPPPTSIIVSTNNPKEFNRDTLTLHFESKKFGGAELVEEGIKITEDGCYILTFTDSDAIERVCAMQHKVENSPLNVSPYYQFKCWTAWNTAIHEINIPEPFAHKVDPVIATYVQSNHRAMKAVQVAMMEIHTGIELQKDAVVLSCLLNLEVKDCRKLVISWRKDAEENWNKCLSSIFLIEKISNLSNIWKDLIDFVKSLIEGKDIMMVEEIFEDYIQVIGFYDEVKTTYVQVMKKKEKLERIGRVAKETMPLKSAAKKRLLDRDGIFQKLRAKFSDFDVHFEQSSEEIVLSGVLEDRNNAKLLIFEELRKFDEPFEISDSTDHFNQFIKEGAPKNYIIKEMETDGLIVDWDVSTEKCHVFVYCIPAHSAKHAATQMKKMVKEVNIPLSQASQLIVTTEDWKMYQAETESRCDGLVHIVVTNDLRNIIWISMEGLYADILQELKDFIKRNTVIKEMIQCNPVIKKFTQTFWEPKDYKEIEETSGDKHLQLTLQGVKSEEIASKSGYIMVIGLSETTSEDNLLNFMEGKSGTNVKDIVYGPRRENAVVIFDGKPDQEDLQSKVSKKTLDGKVIKVFNMPPPTSIIVSTKNPKEFSRDTLTFHFESKKYGGAELVEEGIKITEDGCYILTFTDSDAIERVCAMQHKVENSPLNVSPYYQFKCWTAWNTAIHEINIPEPFAHKVDPVIATYVQSNHRAMKAVQVAMMEIHTGIELQKDAVVLSCLLNLEVKDCRKLVISWRKDAEENWNKCLSSIFLTEKISNLSNIWKDLIDFVKSLIEGKDIMMVEEIFEDYIQVIGFYDEVKTTYVQVMKKKEKLERIGRVAKETMPLKSAAKKRLLDRDGIFQKLRAKFSDFDVHFEQSSEEIVLSGVLEDRNNAKLLIFEELRKFDEPFEISDSTDHFNQFIKEGAPKNYIIKEMETDGLIVDWDVSTEKCHVFVYCIPAHSAEHAATQMKKMVKEVNIPLSQASQLFVTTEDWKMYQAETESRCYGLVHIVVTNDLRNIIWISMEGLYADILQELKDFIKRNTVIKEMIQCNPVIKKFTQTFWEPKDYKEIEETSGDKHLQLTLQGVKSEEIASKPGYIMVIGLSETTSEDNLLNFMEGRSSTCVKEIVYGPRRENAVVIFDGKPDQEDLQSKVSKKTLDGKVIKVFNMPPPTSIIVSTKNPKEFSRDTLTFHFESKKYGGAELVEEGIKITEDGCYILTFTDSDAIERVCAMQHKVENIPLNVSPYYQFICWMAWNTAIHEINIPEPFAHKVDPVIATYVQSNHRAMKAVQVAMMEIHTGIELQKDVVVLSCLLNLEVKDCRKLVISWRKDAEENWNKCLSSIFLIEKISNLSNIWKDLIDFVKSLIEGKDIMLVEEIFEDYIQVIGFYDEVKTTHVQVMKKKEKLERIGRVAKETMPLKSAAKKRLLDRDGIFQKLRAKFSDFDVHFEQSSEEIVLSGVLEDRNIAKLLIFEELRKFDEPFEISDSTDHFNQFIKEGAPKNYIIKEMETDGLIVDWDVSTEKCHVFVYCIPAHSAEHAATQMKKMVKEVNIPLSQASQLFVTTEDWKMYQAETESRCYGLVHIVVTNDLRNIIWISMEGLYADILQELKDFIKRNTVIEEMIQCNPVIKKFMQTFWEPKDYKEIEETSGDKHLQLTLQEDRLMVKGTAEGILKAKELWKVKTSKIVNKSHTLKRVGIKEVLLSEEQSGMLKVLEMKHRCLILTENSNLSSQMEINRDIDDEERIYNTITYACSVGKIKVQVYTGDILDEKTDAIVNSVGGDFSFQGDVANSLKKKCKDLEERCKNKKYVDELGKDGVVVMNITGLPCKEIMHVKFQEHLPGWKKIFQNCFEKAKKHKLVSLSFPVLGTGGGSIEFDPKKIAETFFEALVQFDEENTGHQLQNINIVVFHKQPQFIPEIKEVMKKIYHQGPRGTFGKMMGKAKDFGQRVLPPQPKPAASRRQMSTATIQVYSDMEKNIEHCILNLVKKLDTAYTSACLADELIAKMSRKELEDFFQTVLFVECEFVQEEKQVLIKGTRKHVFEALDLFHKKLMKKVPQENEKRDAEQLYQVVQWQFEEVTEEGVNLVPYDELTNYKMEEAFKKGDVNLELKDPTKKKTYVVDFKECVKFDKEDDEDKVKIVRKDILKDKAKSVPDFWMEMKPDENIRLVNIPNQDPEYTNLENTFITECKTGSYANRIPNLATMKVLKIQRIQNRTLYQQYAAKRQLMIQHYKDKPNIKVEWKAWHGTAQANVDSIYTHGFNRSYCGTHGVWFGQGVYFATNASYLARAWLSAGYQVPPQGTKQFIFYVSVCVGEYIKGDPNMRYLPAKDPTKPTDIYDCAVNDVNNVEEIVIFNDTQAYPDYLITFTT